MGTGIERELGTEIESEIGSEIEAEVGTEIERFEAPELQLAPGIVTNAPRAHRRRSRRTSSGVGGRRRSAYTR